MNSLSASIRAAAADGVLRLWHLLVLPVPQVADAAGLRREAVCLRPEGDGLGLVPQRALSLTLAHSVAGEISADLGRVDGAAKKDRRGLEKDSSSLWGRYMDWLYQHRELGLFLDVSHIGFTDEFVEEMEPWFQAAFEVMEELEKGAITNLDEGVMVGHYWLRNSELEPTWFLKAQIESTLDVICNFATDGVSG